MFLLAKVLWKRGVHSEAEKLLRQAVNVWRAELDDPSVASGLTALAVLLSGTNAIESNHLFLQAHEMLERRLWSE